jgi:diguanylate cyclase (GGDEF)-like protein/PAS domain S-box-containing protein
MKYIGRITLLIFSVIISVVESFSKETNLSSILEALFFSAIAFSVGWVYDRSRFYKAQAEINKEHFQSLIEFSPYPILVYQENKIVFINDKLEQLLHSSYEEIIGKTIFDFVLPEYHSGIIERIKKAQNGAMDVERSQIKIRLGKNKILDIEVTSVPIVYSHKPAVEVFIRDLTAENILAEKSKKNEDLYRFITDNSTDIISYINPYGVYEYMSPSCTQLLGYNQLEIVNQNMFAFIHPEDLEEISKTFTEAKSHIDFASLTHRYKKKDGSFLWLETNARTIRNINKELEGVVTVSRDISKRMEKEENLLKTNERLQYLSNYDSLTDIPNRRYFEQTFKDEWNRTMRQCLSLSLLMIDIDNFKKYNDFYGHQAGDSCIQQIAKAIKRTLKKPGDFVARYGGEEFVVLLPETDLKGAQYIGESLLSTMKKLQIPTEVSEISDYVTLSIGCTSLVPSDQHKPEELIKQADINLYLAKEAGKNQVR